MNKSARWLATFAWRDLAHGSRHLRVFWACLMLGVTLIAGTGGLHRLVSDGLLSDTRSLFGGDVRVDSRRALEPRVLDWMTERGRVSRLIELRTMMLAGEEARLVALQVVDDAYPLYGNVELEPAIKVADAVRSRDGLFGVAIDPVLAERAGLELGDRVDIGNLNVEVRAIVLRQPDRSLSADWRGLPVLISAPALEPSGLVGPGSRLEYIYRVAVAGSPSDWALKLAEAFPKAEFEVRTFEARTGRVTEVLGQAASVLLLIGFSALLVGGIGIFNSVRAHLDTKLSTIAALRAMGLRERPLACIYLGQVLVLAASAAFVGLLVGGALCATRGRARTFG